MLLNLHVKNLAIIDEIEVDFNDGLNIMSGETGAGKSIIIGSINLALGAKVPKDIIREGAEYALIELLFSIEDENIRTELETMDIPLDDNQLLISRKIMGNRNISKVNGETVTSAGLRKIADLLIDIHSQHENQKLMNKKYHIEFLDRYIKEDVAELKANIATVFEEYHNNLRIIEDSCTDNDKRLREISFLEYEINEIESAALKKNEDIELEERFLVLSNMSNIMEGLSEVYQYTSDNKGMSAADSIEHAIKAMTRISEYDNVFDSYKEQLNDIESILSDFNKDIRSYMDESEDYSEEFIYVEQRLNLINMLKAKYGHSIEDIESYYNESVSKLDNLKNYDEYIDNIKSDIKKNEEQLNKYCEQLSSIRKRYALLLSEEVVNALSDLNFIDVNFEINISNKGFSKNGFDDIEFLISTNPGEKLKPIVNVASGGELSRIMLAFKTIMADVDAIDTLIFDEIDTGISGRTAQMVSEKLALISKSRQVICITHLPQIASMADSHYIIEKNASCGTTATNIRKLDNRESIEEIARIIGGAMITDVVLNNAKEMIDLADKIKCEFRNIA